MQPDDHVTPNTPTDNGTHTPEGESQEPQSRSTGATIGIVVVVALLILGALYFWYSGKEAGDGREGPTAEEIVRDDEVTANLRSQSSSDDLDSIEADLEASEFENLDSDATAIDQELQVQ